ncbi:MAG: hypothetical protein ABH950_02305 [Candidatus Altiarchaeota archaeon]
MEEGDTQAEDVTIGDLSPKSRKINVTGKIVDKAEVREVESRKDGSSHRVCEATIGDGSGTVLLSLWDDHVDQVEVEKVYLIKNGYCSLFKNNLRLNIGKYGELAESDAEIAEIKSENNVSSQYFEDDRRDRRSGGGGQGRFGGGGGGNRFGGGGGRSGRGRY